MTKFYQLLHPFVLFVVWAVHISAHEIAPENHIKERAYRFAQGSWFSNLWVPDVAILHSPFEMKKKFSKHAGKILFLGDSQSGCTASILAGVLNTDINETSLDIGHGLLESVSMECMVPKSKEWQIRGGVEQLKYIYASTPADVADAVCSNLVKGGGYSHVILSCGLLMSTLVSNSTIIDEYELQMRRGVDCLIAQNITVLWKTVPAVGIASQKDSSHSINSARYWLNNALRNVCLSYASGCIVLDDNKLMQSRTFGEDSMQRSVVGFKYPIYVAMLQYLASSLFGASPLTEVPKDFVSVDQQQELCDYFAYGSWFGNIWIPRGGVLYGPKRIYELWNNRLHNVLVIGDSLGRRLAAALGTVLEKPSPVSVSHIDLASHVSMKIHGMMKFKRGDHRSLDFVWAPKSTDLRRFVCDEGDQTHKYSHVIINVGTWDISRTAETCDLHVQKYLNASINCLTELNKYVIVKLIPSPTVYSPCHKVYNDMARNLCTVERYKGKKCVALDMYNLLSHRSSGVDRIRAVDAPSTSHYGSDAHVAQIQYFMSSFFGDPH